MTTASITIRSKNRPGITAFSIPMLVLWIVIVPLSVLFAPFILVFCIIDGLDLFDFYEALWRVLRALDGTEFEIEDARRAVAVRIAQQHL